MWLDSCLTRSKRICRTTLAAAGKGLAARAIPAALESAQRATPAVRLPSDGVSGNRWTTVTRHVFSESITYNHDERD